MSIFSKSSTEISYQDVVNFCGQGIGEGVNLDYKKDFPTSGLEKTISAFASPRGVFSDGEGGRSGNKDE